MGIFMNTKQDNQGNSISPLTSETIAISHSSIADFEASQRWVRVKFGGDTIADSTRVMVLRRDNRLPAYCFPKDDVRMDLLEQTQHNSEFAPQGIATYWNVRGGDKISENAAWCFLDPADGWQALKDYMIFEWGKMDAWFEEEEEVFVHLRDPYHRIDVLQSSRHLRIVFGDTTIAETHRPLLLFETGFPTRYYIPREDSRMDLLEPTDNQTRCPYKGIASSYWSIIVGDKVLENSVWSYPDPLPANHKIKDYLCFFNERVDAIYVNDELVPKPVTPWSS